MRDVGTDSEFDLLPREAEPEPAYTLVILDVLFCDNESDPEILERYFTRFQHALASIQAQQVPEAAELLVTIQMSSDKREWLARTAELLRTPPASRRTRIQIYEYDHPEEGYVGGDPERMDWVKKPNLHSPYRERMFISTHQGLHLDRYARVIRVGLDDDDLWMPWQTANICAAADAARLDPKIEHDGVLAIGMLDTLIAYVDDSGIDVDSVQLKRSLTGEKFHVIDNPGTTESIAGHSPSAVPEKVDIEFHKRFLRRGVGLYATGGFVPGFVYMRWGQNLSRQGKEYLETKRYGRVRVSAPGEVAQISREELPHDDRRLWFSVPGAAVPLRVRARRVGTTIQVDCNLEDQPGKGLKVSYYLMRGTERVATRWYSTDPAATFEDAPASASVRAYLRSADGKTVRAESEKV